MCRVWMWHSVCGIICGFGWRLDDLLSTWKISVIKLFLNKYLQIPKVLSLWYNLLIYLKEYYSDRVHPHKSVNPEHFHIL